MSIYIYWKFENFYFIFQLLSSNDSLKQLRLFLRTDICIYHIVPFQMFTSFHELYKWAW